MQFFWNIKYICRRSLIIFHRISFMAESSHYSPSSSSSDSEQGSSCLLGLLKPFNEDPRVSSRFAFPCKVGGRPAWLEAKNVPKRSDVLCGTCSQRLEFLLQIYAPLDSEIIGHDEAFHRMLYVFYCVNPACTKEKEYCSVLRSQLSAENPFYSIDFESNLLLGLQKGCGEAEINVCVVCCQAASSFCGKCRRRYYCSRECQVVDWRLGHRDICPSTDNCIYYYFPPFLLDISEEEPESVSHQSPSIEKTFSDDEELEDIEKETTSTTTVTRDKIFERFQLRTSQEPNQVLRYAPRGECLEPLWFREEKRILDESCEVPPCPYCGEPRVFEFQVMPQLLYFLEEKVKQSACGERTNDVKLRYMKNSIEFGTIVVYTCRKSCSLKKDEHFSFYAKEFVRVQDAFSY